MADDAASEKGFQDALLRFRKRDLLDPVDFSRGDVEQRLRLARTNWERAVDVAVTRRDDYDFHYQTMYSALIDAGGALLSCNQYRVKGHESSHATTLELAALGLAVSDPDAAKRLFDVKDRARRVRRQAAYDRSGVIGKRERDEFFIEATEILRALEMSVSRQAGLVVPGHEWKLPDLE